jgi:hypothetical protein
MIGGNDYIVSQEYNDLKNNLQKVLFPNINKNDKHYTNKINDLDHLTGHKYALRDYFVTSDRDFLDKKDKLKNDFSIEAISLEDCVSILI